MNSQFKKKKIFTENSYVVTRGKGGRQGVDKG